MSAATRFNTSYELKCLGRERFLMQGSIRPQGSSALVDADTAPGVGHPRGFSVARVSTGLNRITFGDGWHDLESIVFSARKADSTAMLVQGGDYNATNRTVDFRTFVAGGGSALTRALAMDVTNAMCAQQERDYHDIGEFTMGSTPPTLNSTAGGRAFDADAETAYLRLRVPDDWDGASNLTFRVWWHPISGTAIALNETVIWQAVWRATPNGTAVDHDTAITVTGTHTETDNPGTDKELIQTDITLDYDATNQVWDKGDIITIALSRQFSTDTYANDAVVLGAELVYETLPKKIQPYDGTASSPYIQRVNGTTDPTWQIVWPAGVVTPVYLNTILPAGVDGTQDVTATLRALMSGATDTPDIDVQAWESTGDTEMGGDTAALSDSEQNLSVTLDAADITDDPEGLPLTFALVPQTHNTDDVYVRGARVEYTATDNPDSFALADLSDDVDNRVSFMAILSRSGIDGVKAT